MTTPADPSKLRERAEAVIDRIANEFCGHCLYGLPINCTCPTVEDHIGWVADFARDEVRRELEELVWIIDNEADHMGDLRVTITNRLFGIEPGEQNDG